MKYNYLVKTELDNLILGIIEADNISVEQSPVEFLTLINNLCNETLAGKKGLDDSTRTAIRKLLKYGKYRATGRGKPASEYLYNLIKEGGSLPLINNIVEANNYISLLSGYPISIFDIDKCTSPMIIRHGKDDEKYVFNQSGQELDLKDLLLVADSNCDYPKEDGRPIGNPIKDSMATKVFEDAKNIIGVIYSSKDVCIEKHMQNYLEEFKNILLSFANASDVRYTIL